MTEQTRDPRTGDDQYSAQDPTRQDERPPTAGRTIEHPGTTDAMDARPDHGEQSYRGSGRLEGRAALITGGDSGIGRAVALAFAREGADVAVTFLEGEEQDARETAALVEDAGRHALAIPADLRDESACAAVVDRTVDELGRLDILVNNAAYQMSQDGGLEDITTEQFDRVMKTNLYALFWTTRAALPHLGPGASIINTSSIQAFQPSPHLLDYAMTKAAIVSFTKALALQLTERGVRVNSVAPGPVWTPLIPATMDAERVASFGEQSPLGRAAQPAELAPAFVFLASQESSYVTAEVLAVTGGMAIV